MIGQWIRRSAIGVLLNVGGNSDNVSDGKAGPGYVNSNNLTNTNTNNGSRLNFV